MVDVPGHERFVRTMVAGATGIDLFLMVVAADDGVMPQTREHAAVLRALGVGVGVVAITKADLADPARAAAEAAELLPGRRDRPRGGARGRGRSRSCGRRSSGPPAACRARRSAPARCGSTSTARSRSAAPGTVVTGTLWSGIAARGDEVRILPAGTPARVRSVQVHDEPRERAEAGQRVALNLAGVARDEVARGDVIVAGAAPLAASYRVDVALEWATPDHRPDGGTRVAVHHGTRETAARLAELGGRYFQLRLEQPLVPARGDRLVIRSLAPPDTLGGGVVLDPDPPRHGPSRDLLARLARLERGRAGARRPPPPRRAPAAQPALAAAHPRRARARGAPARGRPRAAARRRAAGRGRSPRCAPTAASPASAAACTSTATRSPTVARARHRR